MGRSLSGRGLREIFPTGGTSKFTWNEIWFSRLDVGEMGARRSQRQLEIAFSVMGKCLNFGLVFNEKRFGIWLSRRGHHNNFEQSWEKGTIRGGVTRPGDNKGSVVILSFYLSFRDLVLAVVILEHNQKIIFFCPIPSNSSLRDESIWGNPKTCIPSNQSLFWVLNITASSKKITLPSLPHTLCNIFLPYFKRIKFRYFSMLKQSRNGEGDEEWKKSGHLRGE